MIVFAPRVEHETEFMTPSLPKVLVCEHSSLHASAPSTDPSVSFRENGKMFETMCVMGGSRGSCVGQLVDLGEGDL